MDRLYAAFERRLRSHSQMSILAAARVMAQIAEQRVARNPECAFVECTQFQAEGHAREVRARLGVPCMVLTTSEIAGRRSRIPRHVRTLLTTRFHYAELAGLAVMDRLTVTALPIELDPEFLTELGECGATDVHVLALKRQMARSIAADLSRRAGRPAMTFRSQGVSVAALNGILSDILGGKAHRHSRLVVLSPTLWTEARDYWKQRSDVRPFVYRIVDSAWPQAADAAGVPLIPLRPAIEHSPVGTRGGHRRRAPTIGRNPTAPS